MKSDRQTYKTQYSPSGGLPLATGDTESLFMPFHRSFAWSPTKDIVRFPLKKRGNDKKKELSFRDDFARNLTKVKVRFLLETYLPDASLWQASWNDRKIVTDVGSVTPLRLCCETSNEDYVGSRTTMSYELTMEKVFLECNKPPDRNIDKYFQRAGNHCLKTQRSIQSPQERDVSFSWMTGQILQRWSRVYSFSSTIGCAWKIGEHKIVYRLYSGENKSTYKVMLRYLNRCRTYEDDNHYEIV